MSILQNSNAISAPAGGADFYTHQIAKSCRFDGAGKYLRTNGSAPTLATKYTFSTWLKRSKLGAYYALLASETNNVNYDIFQFTNGNLLEQVSQRTTSYVTRDLSVYRDTSAYYHLVFQWDTTLASATDRLKVYVNGVRLAWDQTQYSGAIPQNTALKLNENGASLSVGYSVSYASIFNGYMAQTAGIDGSIVAIGDLGETKNGVWIAKDLSGLTFGANGFLLDYASSGDMGNDVSGNNNDFTPTSIAAHDQMLDSPTFDSTSNGGNFATLNPLNTRGTTAVATQLTEGNLMWTPGATQDETSGTMSIGAGGVNKVYMEVYCVNNSDTGWFGLYDQKDGSLMNAVVQSTASSVRFKPRTGQKVTAGTSSNYIGDGSEVTTLNIIYQMAIDVDAGKIWWGKNNAWGSDGDSAPTASNVAFTTLNTDGTFLLFTHTGGASVAQPDWVFNFGQDGTFAGNKTAGGNADGSGYGNFFYAPPAGFLALCSGNLATAAAVDPAQTDTNYPQKMFNTKLYTGTGASLANTGLGFQPDLTWIKDRGAANAHKLTDSTRGVTKALVIDDAAAETTDAQGLTAFGTDGFTVGTDSNYNTNTNTYASWNWRLNGGTTASNTDGGITSTVQVDPSGGFSLVKYTGTGSASTVGHGLSSAPTWIFAKKYDATSSWIIYTTAMTGSYYMTIDAGGMGADSTMWNNTNSTSSVFSVGTATNTNSGTMLAYCWADVEGYIKSGSYEGNGDVNGSFVYTGFRPAFIICKSIDSATSWQLFDDKRVGYNVDNNSFLIDLANAETTTDMIDIVSNGFKFKIATDPNIAETYIYLAVASNPFQYATAR
jgi:hypothetical protein